MSSHTCRLPLAFQEAEWVAVIVRAVSVRYTRPIRVSALAETGVSLSARPGVSCTALTLALKCTSELVTRQHTQILTQVTHSQPVWLCAPGLRLGSAKVRNRRFLQTNRAHTNSEPYRRGYSTPHRHDRRAHSHAHSHTQHI